MTSCCIQFYSLPLASKLLLMLWLFFFLGCWDARCWINAVGSQQEHHGNTRVHAHNASMMMADSSCSIMKSFNLSEKQINTSGWWRWAGEVTIESNSLFLLMSDLTSLGHHGLDLKKKMEHPLDVKEVLPCLSPVYAKVAGIAKSGRIPLGHVLRNS